MKMFKFLSHQNIILTLAFILGLSCPRLAEWTKSLTIPALALVMTVSIIQIPTRQILKWQSLVKPLAVGVLFNYLFLGSLFLISSRWFINSEAIRVGMILVASAPPGIAVIPFTSLLGGNLILSLLALFGTYLSAFLIMPGLILLLTSAEGFPISRLFLALVELIILPVFFSRLLIFKDFYKSILAHRGMIVNWGFFVVIFTVIGLNQENFLAQPDILIKISLIALLATFLGLTLLDILLKKVGINQKDRISMLLLGTIKNSGFAAAIALTLFDRTTSIPAAIISAVYGLYMIWLGVKGKNQSKL